ncbi:MAG: asparagine synthase-related protein [Pseudonocardiaceae bacterium]
MSNRPVFYSIGDDASVLVASQIRGIRNAQPARLDVAGLASFLVPQLCDPTGTCWHGIHRLPPGHLLTWWDGQIDIQQVSQIDELDYDDASTQELVREFRSRFTRAVTRCSEPPDAILLSGGIDSSALTCAYAAILGIGSGRGYSLTYDHKLGPCDERRFVDDVEHTTGISVHRMAANRLLPLIASFPEGDEPEPWPYASRNWTLLQTIAADAGRSPTTVIAGEGGDELLLGQVFSVAARLARGDTAGGTRELVTFPEPANTDKIVKSLIAGAYDGPGARMVRSVGDTPSWLTTTFLADTDVLVRLANGYPRLGPATHMVSTYSRELMREMGAAGRVQCGGWCEDMGRRLGLKIVYPFLDPDLTALAWSLPPQLLRDQGREKVILREALADLLPSSVYERVDKAEALALLHSGLSEAIQSVRTIAYSGPLADLGIINPGRLLVAIDRYLAGNHSLAPALWATASVDGWLQHQSEAEQK